MRARSHISVANSNPLRGSLAHSTDRGSQGAIMISNNNKINNTGLGNSMNISNVHNQYRKHDQSSSTAATAASPSSAASRQQIAVGAGTGTSSTAAVHFTLHPSSSSPARLKLRLAIHVVIFSVRLRRIARFAVRLTRHEVFMVKDAYTKFVRSGAVLKGGEQSESNSGDGGGKSGEGGGGGGAKNQLSLVPSPTADNPEGIIHGMLNRGGKQSQKESGDEEEGGEEVDGSPASIILKLAEVLGISEVAISDARTIIKRLLGHNSSSKAAASMALLKSFPSTTKLLLGGSLNQPSNIKAAVNRRLTSQTGGGNMLVLGASVNRSQHQQQQNPPPAERNGAHSSSSSALLLRPGEIMSEDTAVRAIELLKQLANSREEEEAREGAGGGARRASSSHRSGGGGGGPTSDGLSFVSFFNNSKRLALANQRLGVGHGGEDSTSSNKQRGAQQQPSFSSPIGFGGALLGSKNPGLPSSFVGTNDPFNEHALIMNATGGSNASNSMHASSTTTAQIQQQQLLRKHAQELTQASYQLNQLFEMLADKGRQCTSIDDILLFLKEGAAPGGGGMGEHHHSSNATMNTVWIKPQIPPLNGIGDNYNNNNNGSAISSSSSGGELLAPLTLVQELFDVFGLKIDAISWALRNIALPVLFPFGNYVSARTRQLNERFELYRAAVVSGAANGKRNSSVLAPRGGLNVTTTPANQQQHPNHHQHVSVLDEADLDNEGGYAGLAGHGYYGVANEQWLTAEMINAIPTDFKKAATTTYADLLSADQQQQQGTSSERRRSSSSSSCASYLLLQAIYANSSTRGGVGGGEGKNYSSDNGSHSLSNMYANTHNNNNNSDTVGDDSSSPPLSPSSNNDGLPSSTSGGDLTGDSPSPSGGGNGSEGMASTAADLSSSRRLFSVRALAPFTDKARHIIRNLSVDDAFINREFFQKMLDAVPSNSTPTLTSAAKKAMLMQKAVEAATANDRQRQMQLLHALKQQQRQLTSFLSQSNSSAALSASTAKNRKGLPTNTTNLSSSRSDSARTGGARREGNVSLSSKKTENSILTEKEKTARKASGGSSPTAGASSTSAASLLPFGVNPPTTKHQLQQQQQAARSLLSQTQALETAILNQQQMQQSSGSLLLSPSASGRGGAVGSAAGQLPSHLAALAQKQREDEERLARQGPQSIGTSNSAMNDLDNGTSRGNGGHFLSATLGGDRDETETVVKEQIQLHRLLREGEGEEGKAKGNGGKHDKQLSVTSRAAHHSAAAVQQPNRVTATTSESTPPTNSKSSEGADNFSPPRAGVSFGLNSSPSPSNDPFSRKVMALSRTFSDPRLVALSQRAQQSAEVVTAALASPNTNASKATGLVDGLGGGNGGTITNEKESMYLQGAQRRQVRHNQTAHSLDRGYRPAVGGRSLWKLDDHSAFGLDPRTGKPVVTRKDAIFESSLIGRFNGHPGRKSNRRRKNNKSKVAERGEGRRGGDDSDSSSASFDSSEYDENGRKIIDPHRHVQSVIAQYINGSGISNNNNNSSGDRGFASRSPSPYLRGGGSGGGSYGRKQPQQFSGDQFVRCIDVVIPTTTGVSQKEHIRAQSACSDRSRPPLSTLVGGRSSMMTAGSRNHYSSHQSTRSAALLPPRPNSAMSTLLPHSTEGGGKGASSPSSTIQSQPFRTPIAGGDAMVGTGGHRVGDTYLNPSRTVLTTATQQRRVASANMSHINNTALLSSANPVKDLFDNRPQSGIARRLRRQLPTPTIDTLAGTPAFILPQRERSRIMHVATSPASSSFVASAGSNSISGNAAEMPMNRETVAVAGAVLGALQNNKYFSTRNTPLF